MMEGDFVAFEMSMSRMMMFIDNKALMAFDRAVSDAVKNGVTMETISAAATAFGGAAKTLPKARASKVLSIMTGGLVTRLKMEAEGVIRENKANLP